jgi:hypothetical protein
MTILEKITISGIIINVIFFVLWILLFKSVKEIRNSIVNESFSEVVQKFEMGRVYESQGKNEQALEKFHESLVLLNIHSKNLKEIGPFRIDSLKQNILNSIEKQGGIIPDTLFY